MKKVRCGQSADFRCLTHADGEKRMSADAEEMTSSKPRKRTGAKAAVRQSAEKVKVSIVLSADVDFKLSVASAALRMDRSALVNQILAESPTMRRFVVQDRAKPANESTGDVSA